MNLSKYINNLLLWLIISICFCFFYGCVKDPSQSIIPNNISEKVHGIYVLCEGTMGYNNSTLSKLDLDTLLIYNDYFFLQNRGIKLGDIANDIEIIGDTAIVAVSGSKTILSFNVKTGKIIKYLNLTGNRYPRKICITSDSTAYFTDLYANCICKINIKDLTIIHDNITVGPAPEGITFCNGFLFVANSGYGDYFANKPKAGTISVIDEKMNMEIANLPCGPDVIQVISDKKKNLIYAAYSNLPSKPDSLGGLVIYDAVSFKEIKRWRCKIWQLTEIAKLGDSILFLNEEGLGAIDTKNNSSTPQIIIKNNKPKELWYTVSVNPNNNDVWIGNAKDFQSNGELIQFKYGLYSSATANYKVGVNPGAIIFY
ncbi:MAG: hypothetical protein NT007_04150 [Candidatus Kapabacteria bacterium]|nr:hypothetical protein [Candidatus Kapabacteria bacterium]